MAVNRPEYRDHRVMLDQFGRGRCDLAEGCGRKADG